MIEYAVISRDTDVDLRDAVNGLAKLGWRPQGGVAVGYRDEWIDPVGLSTPVGQRGWRVPPVPKRRMYWVQAMVREGETK